jgi:hypothetical protein
MVMTNVHAKYKDCWLKVFTMVQILSNGADFQYPLLGVCTVVETKQKVDKFRRINVLIAQMILYIYCNEQEYSLQKKCLLYLVWLKNLPLLSFQIHVHLFTKLSFFVKKNNTFISYVTYIVNSFLRNMQIVFNNIKRNCLNTKKIKWHVHLL